MNLQAQAGSEVQTHFASIMGGSPASWWPRAAQSGQVFGEDSRFFPESQPLLQADHKTGCIRGIFWAFALQAVAVVAAVALFKILHAV